MSQRAIAFPVVGVVLLALALLASTMFWRAADAAEGDVSRTVSVSGEGRVTLTPDLVTITLGVDTRNADLGTAQSEAAQKMDALIAALRGAGIAERDIQTSGYNIGVEYDYNQPNRPLIGYYVSHSVTVKVRDIDRAGTTIETAVNAGATSVHGVWFGLSDTSSAIRQARELAVADARAKAEELARLTDSTLGPVQTISEGYSSGPIYGSGAAGYAYDMAASAPPINPGQTDVVLNVMVTYALN